MGALGILGLVYVQRDERSVLTLTFAFDVIALGTFPLLVPFGHIPVLAVGIVTATVLTLLRLEPFFSLPPEQRLGFWATGLVLTYGVLLANTVPFRGAGVIDDLTILATFVTLTVAFTISEVLVGDRGHPVAFAAILGVLALPVPLLMTRGEIALVVYPAVLLALVLLRPTRGLAWFANVAYLGILMFAAAGLSDPTAQFTAAWSLFFGTMGVHAILQERSGYAIPREGLPADLPVCLYVVALAGVTARTVPGPSAFVAYAFALPLAILLNRTLLTGSPERVAMLVAMVGGSMVLARWWAVEPWITGSVPSNAPALATFHVAMALGLGVWIAYRKSRALYPLWSPGLSLRFSWPALALLTGLLAQDGSEAHVLLALPLAVLALGYYLEDPVTFHAAYVALAGQAAAGVSPFLEEPSEALLLLPVFAGALLGLGFSFDLSSTRKAFAILGELTAVTMWVLAALLAFGPGVETTIAWALVGGVAIAWGLWRKFAALRYLGILALFAVLGKAFLYDIAGLDISLRIVGLIVVAASLLAISYGYARYRKRFSAAG